jgi:site-specific DNA-methyltransferase (adenine-specific)
MLVLGSGAQLIPVNDTPKFFNHAGNASGQHDWETPRDLLERLYRVFNRFDLDPCSPSANKRTAPVHARVHYTADDNGLVLPWFGNVFVNPPYGRELRYWVEKGRNEVATGNAEAVIALIPARTDTTWWHDYIASQADVFFLRGRLSFGQSGQSAPFPSALVVWGASPGMITALEPVLPEHWRA